ncbi:MAG TPA: hypothetical protein VGY54_20595, partial [Polyangiaceae bacterium]|nr:hypothetical protein [Polyangiaceae bacterium]
APCRLGRPRVELRDASPVFDQVAGRFRQHGHLTIADIDTNPRVMKSTSRRRPASSLYDTDPSLATDCMSVLACRHVTTIWGVRPLS